VTISVLFYSFTFGDTDIRTLTEKITRMARIWMRSVRDILEGLKHQLRNIYSPMSSDWLLRYTNSSIMCPNFGSEQDRGPNQ
jgi:hypothetical protein